MKRQALRRPPARPHSIEALEQRIAPATFTVTNVNDIGAGSLREAITNANNTAGPDVIDFNILGATGGLKTIALRSALPRIFDSVLIDGYTQPGASPNTLGPGFGTNATPLIETGLVADRFVRLHRAPSQRMCACCRLTVGASSCT